MNTNVRRAYPIHKADETKTTKVTLQPVDPFPFLAEETSDSIDTDEDDISDGDNNVDANNENIADFQETSQGTSSDSFPYSLRSRTNVPNLPLTMHKPVEYSRNK